jgi:glc operon protein GlcG
MKLEYAEKALAAAKAKAVELGVLASIAVVDRRGDIVALARLDGAGYFAADFARGKAMVSGTLGRPSGAFNDPSAGSATMQRILGEINHGQIGIVFLQGAVPVVSDGEVIGAVGVGGGTSAQDEEIAEAGAAAV